MLKEGFKWLINRLYPNKCIVCSTPDFLLCESCFYEIESRLSYKKIYGKDFGVVEDLNIYYFFDYKNKYIKEAIRQIKFYHDYSSLKFFASKMLESIETLLEDRLSTGDKKIYLIPIPNSFLARNIYSHTTLLCKEIVNLNETENNIGDIEVLNILQKYNTEKQSHTKSRLERKENMKNTFSVKSVYVCEKDAVYILVDDVVTTGATIMEAKKELKKNGIKLDLCLTIAH